MKQFLSVRLIRQKSKQLNIPYQNLLVGCAREWMLEQIVSVSIKEAILIQRVSLLEPNAYKTGVYNTLYLAVEESMFDEEKVTILMKEAFEELSYQVDKGDDQYKVRVIVPVDQLGIPIDLYITKTLGKRDHMQKISLRLCYENERRLEISCCNSEAELAYFLWLCLEKMELLSDMTVLDSIYAYLKSRQIDGRYLQSCIEEQLDISGFTLTNDILVLFYKSMKSKILRQRFQGYLHAHKRRDIKYEQIVDLMEKAYHPVLEACLKEEIFLGDWMPEVERYL